MKTTFESKSLHEIESLDKERVENPVAAAYRRAEEIVWATLQDYQKESIIESRKNPDRDDHIARAFAREVARLAEKELEG